MTVPQLVVTVLPGSVTVGSDFGLTVTAEDGSGNVDTAFNGTVTVALSNNPGSATLGGTLTVTAQDGVATFSDLTLDQLGVGYTLQVSSSSLALGKPSRETVYVESPRRGLIGTTCYSPFTTQDSLRGMRLLECGISNLESL